MQPHRHPTVPLLFFIAVHTVACQGDSLVEPAIGTLEIIVSTTGPAPDTDGYQARVDDEPSHSVYVGGPAFISSVAGEHAVTLDGLAANCSVSGENPRMVTIPAGDTLAVSFAVTCSATSGTIMVVTSTTGGFADQDGYDVVVDGATHSTIQATWREPVRNLPAGSHTIELGGVAPNCRVSGVGQRRVEIEAGGTHELVFDVDCSVSPPIAFGSNRGAGERSVYVVNPDGSGLTKFTSGHDGVWSPDGQKMAVSSAGNLYLVNRDRTAFSELFLYPPGTEGAVSPRWSPDGRSIAFTLRVLGSCERWCYFNEIWTIRADGTGLRRLGTGDAASWSPDGKRLSFGDRDIWSGDRDIWTINADGSSLTQLTPLAGDASQPAWSPDGTRIAFTNTLNQATISELFTVHPDGTGLMSLTIGHDRDEWPTWSPDGTRIAFLSRVSTELVDGHNVLGVMNSDGSGRVILTDPDAFSVGYQTWSPDGRSIVFSGRDNINGDWNFEIYVIDADGSGLRNLSNSSAYDAAPSWSFK